jgi:hypothetical protein
MSETNGKRFIDRLIAASPTARQKIRVLDQDVYFRPVTRKALADAIPKDDGGVERPPDYIPLFVLVATAEDEQGNKLFALSDVDSLRERVSVQLIHQIEAAMMATILPSDDQVMAVVNGDPSSASA